MLRKHLVVMLIAALLAACATAPVRRTTFLETHQGKASWYGPGFQGRRTASGERFNQRDFTAAHRTLPFGTKVQVTNLMNGKTVVVRINDRGPYGKGRIIDLSKAAAKEIDMIHKGVVPVEITVLDRSPVATTEEF